MSTPITPETGNAPPQGASAITSESVPLLSDAEIDSIAKPFLQSVGDHWCHEDAITEQSVEGFARRVEQAVRSKLGAVVPMKRGWMCLTDYRYELGEATGGVTLYSDFEDLKACRPCWSSCGVIEVGIVGKEGA